MNCGIPVAKDTYWVGVNDRQTDLFESIWPLPRGVSYNAYLVADEKVALIDTVKSCYEADLIGKIQGILGKDRGVDYLIVNHMEPDHSGAIKVLKGESKIAEMPIEYAPQFTKKYNADICAALGLTPPAGYEPIG